MLYLKKTIAVILIVFILLEIIVISGNFSRPWKNADYIVVLGAKLHGKEPSESLRNRLDAALKYSRDNEKTKIIVSGGQGADEEIPESHAMKNYLLENGIEEDRILVEDKSTSTLENLKFSDELYGLKDRKVLIVTQGYHIFRSKMIAGRLGIKAKGLPAKTPGHTVVKMYLREAGALVKSFIVDRP